MKLSRNVCTVAVSLLTGMVGWAAGQSTDREASLDLVREHFEYFNEHDVEALTDLVADDVAWYTIEGGEITPNAKNSEELADGLFQYFEGVPTVSAELEHLHAAGSFVVARERVRWETSAGKEQSQASYSVYEIRDDAIQAVWYFRAE